MNDIDVLVLQQNIEILIADIDAEVIAHVVEFLFIALANGVAVRVRMFLPERDEFRAEAKSYDGNVNLLAH